jgi:hypothetical protein
MPTRDGDALGSGQLEAVFFAMAKNSFSVCTLPFCRASLKPSRTRLALIFTPNEAFGNRDEKPPRREAREGNARFAVDFPAIFRVLRAFAVTMFSLMSFFARPAWHDL